MSEVKTETPELLTAEEVAEVLRCGRTYVYQLMVRGSLPSLRVGRLRRVRRVDLDEFIGRRVRSDHAFVPEQDDD